MTKLTGTSGDLQTLQTLRAKARGVDQTAFVHLTYLLGEIDRKRGGKNFDAEKVALETTGEMVVRFNNAAEDEKIQSNFELICQYKSMTNFYLKLMPELLSRDEMLSMMETMRAEGAKFPNDYLKKFEAGYCGRYERAFVVNTAKQMMNS